jgi:hypothetical protein
VVLASLAAAPAPARHREVHESCGTQRARSRGARCPVATGVECTRADPSLAAGPARAVLDSGGHRATPAPRQSKAAMMRGKFADIASFLRPVAAAAAVEALPAPLAPAEVRVCHSALQRVSGGPRDGSGARGPREADVGVTSGKSPGTRMGNRADTRVSTPSAARPRVLEAIPPLPAREPTERRVHKGRGQRECRGESRDGLGRRLR